MSSLTGSRSRQVRLAPDVVVQVIGGDALVLHLPSETVFSLNATGARIATLIEAGTGLEAVIDTLAAEYSADRAEVARDVDDLVNILIAKGLLVARPDEGMV
jgi:hypothetical protein